MPLMWAHAEYIQLLRSALDGQIFDFIPEVAQRYGGGTERKLLDIWKPNRQLRSVKAGWTLRIQAPVLFQLHWTDDAWQTAHDTDATVSGIGITFVDIPIAQTQRAPIQFTFHWLTEDRWEGRDYVVSIDNT